ncbi:MAG TPA: helix-turn-helix transcriptional regulator [Candidatus Competibacter sp.]|nr:helix-turn-helix transcriptional regulator [Candidatus Competibacter sp.]
MPKPLTLIGQAIKCRRNQLGLSQEKLADKCGFDRTYVSMLERGKRNPSLLNLIRIAKGLETSVSQLTEVIYGFNSESD